MNKPWCIYSKAAIQYRETLVNYLARYSHRIGLSNHRLLESTSNQVTLVYHDYRAARNGKLHLAPEALVRRFLLHVLPKGSCAFDTMDSYRMQLSDDVCY